MSQCEKKPACLFFNDRLAHKPATADMFKERYCANEWSECARFIVSKAIGSERVPNDLFPNMRARALEIINADAPSK